MLEKPDFIGWVRITADDKTLLDFCYDPLRSGVCYKVSLVPEIEPSKTFLRVFLEDMSFHVVHESRFLILDENECMQLDRNEKLDKILI